MPRTYTTPNGSMLHFVRQIGNGQFGVANLVRKGRDDFRVMKEIPVKVSDEVAKQDALNEVKLMKETCNHDNIVTFYESWFERGRLCILMEYAANGSLDKLIEKCALQNTMMPPKKVVHFVEELAGALDYCHNTLRIIHRDIKPANILIDELGSLKLTDFGLSKALGPVNNLATTFCGSPLYMAPEQLTMGERYSFPADMWAFGCVVFEIMTLESPWSPVGAFPVLVHRICNSSPNYAQISSRYSPHLIALTRLMLQRRVHKRATASQIVAHLELRAPPELAETIHRRKAPPPPPPPVITPSPDTPTATDVFGNATVILSPSMPRDTDYEHDTEMQRRMNIVADAKRLASAAASIQRSYRLSQQMRKHLKPPPPPVEESATPLKLFERREIGQHHTRVHAAPAPRRLTAHRNESAAVIQTALRASLNRRRRDVPTRPHRAIQTPINGSADDPVKCSTRIDELAQPRMPRGRAFVLPNVKRIVPVTRQPMPPHPRPAWL